MNSISMCTLVCGATGFHTLYDMISYRQYWYGPSEFVWILISVWIGLITLKRVCEWMTTWNSGESRINYKTGLHLRIVLLLSILICLFTNFKSRLKIWIIIKLKSDHSANQEVGKMQMLIRLYYHLLVNVVNAWIKASNDYILYISYNIKYKKTGNETLNNDFKIAY